MNNCLLKNPVIVRLVDTELQPQQTFVFIGDVIAKVESVLQKYNDKKTFSSSDNAILREYYGTTWKSKLGMTAVKTGGANDTLVHSANDTLVHSTNGTLLHTGGVDDIDDDLDDLDLDDIASALEHVEEDTVVADETDDIYREEEQIKIDVNFNDTSEPDFDNDGGVTFVLDIAVYPEDKITELREKIYVATGVNVYRQHLFWYEQSNIKTPYKIYAEGIYDVDINAAFKNVDERYSVLGMPVDKMLYNLRDELKVENVEQFTLCSGLHNNNTFYIVDANAVMDNIRIQLAALINDTYKFDLFYYGFVVRFWPQMIPEVFKVYVVDKNEIPVRYPELSPSTSVLIKRFDAERDIISDNYSLSKKINAIIEKRNVLKVAIISMIASTIGSSGATINIRNLFDKLHVSRCMPQIHAYVLYDNKRMLLKKTHQKNQSDIAFPSMFRNGLTIAISIRKSDQKNFHAKSSSSTLGNEQSRYIFFNIMPNGKYYIKSMWNEEDNHDFSSVIKITKAFVDPIVKNINSFGRYVFVTGSSLKILTSTNITYKSLNVSLFYKKMISESMFKIIKSHFADYTAANIISTRGIQQSSTYEFTFRKGITQFDLSVIERVLSAANLETMNNHYAKMANNTLGQKWKQLYDGRVVKMSHRTTDIKFEVMNIREQEFQIFYEYLARFVIRAGSDERLKQPIKISRDIKKLKKLKETDPELYNLKKHGSKKVYSILCQNPRQPVVYTDDEIDAMSARDRKKLIEFKNFTSGDPAFYGCPSTTYPHLSFIPGVHPKGFCLPCCGKTPPSEGSKKMKIINKCLTDFKYTDDTSPVKSRHIMAYGKDIMVDRISKLPSSAIKGMLYNSLDDDSSDYYIYGVKQHFKSAKNVGVLYTLASALDMPVVLCAQKILDELSEQEEIFPTLLNGSLVEIFDNFDNFFEHLHAVFISQTDMDFVEINKFKKYNELFIELSMLLLNIYMFVFIDTDGSGETTDLYITDAMRSEILYLSSSASETKLTKYILMINRIDDYYPIYVINTNTYFRDDKISARTYKYTDDVIGYIYKIIKSVKTVSTINCDITIGLLKEFTELKKNYTIDCKFVNNRNLIYAVLIKTNVCKVYIPVDYSANISDEIKAVRTVFSRNDYKLELAELMKFIAALNKYITTTYSTANSYRFRPIVPKTILIFENKAIGFTTSSFTYYYSDAGKIPNVREENILYDPDVVNNAIASAERPVEDNRIPLANVGLYANYMYNLIVMEFVNAMDKERNKKIRKQINGAIATLRRDKWSEFQDQIRGILVDFPSDIDNVMSQLSQFYYTHHSKKTLLNDIQNSIYDFDHVTVNAIKVLPRDQLRVEVNKIVKSFIVEKSLDIKTMKFPNIYLPCEFNSAKNSYCSGKSIILSKESSLSIDDIVSMLVDDISNPLKIKYMFNGLFSDNIINYFAFEQRPLQNIVVIKI